MAVSDWSSQMSKQKKGSSKQNLTVSRPGNRSGTVLAIVLVAIVLALVIVFVKIATTKHELAAQPADTIAGTKTMIDFAEPQTYETGRGIWLKAGKVLTNEEITAEAKKGTKVLELYYDYLCNICNDVEAQLNDGQQLNDLVEGGQAIVVLRPTLTHAQQLKFPNIAFSANNLMYWTAEYQPDKLWELSKDLTGFAMNNYKSADYEKNQNNTEWAQTIREPDAELAKIAAAHGIDYKSVPPATPESGLQAINILAEQRVKSLGRDSAGTPLYIANGRVVDLTGLGSDDKLLEKATL